MRTLESIRIICGQGGLNTSKSPDLVHETDAVAFEGITLEDDTWKKEGGATLFNSVGIPSAPISSHSTYGALHQFVTDSGVSELMASNGEQVFVVGSGGVTKTVLSDSSIAIGVRCPFTEGYDGTQKALYYFNGLTGSVGGGPWVYTGGSSAFRVGADVGTVTADSGTDTFTRTSHGLTNGTIVCFHNSGGGLPSGIDIVDHYYVINSAANTFQISTVLGGSAYNFTSNGTGTHTVRRLTAAVDWLQDLSPSWGFMHRGRMIVGGGGDLHRVYTSVLNNHNDFLNSGALTFLVYPGEGSAIVGGISWREKAYLFKYPRGIYVLDDASTDTADWGFKRVSKYVGGISHASIVEADDEVYFPSSDGYIHALSAVQESGDVRSSAVMPLHIGPYLRDSTDFSRLPIHPSGSFYFYPATQGVYYPEKRQVVFGFVANPNTIGPSGLPVNALRVTLDLHRSSAREGISDAAYTVSGRDKCETLTIYIEPTTGRKIILAGDQLGFIFKLDQAARSKDGLGYLASFQTKDFYPYGSEQNANLRELEVVFAPTSSNNTITMKVYRDGVLSDTKTLTDSDRVMRLHGDCRRFHVTGENSTVDESFSVSQLIVRYRPGNWRKHS